VLARHNLLARQNSWDIYYCLPATVPANHKAPTQRHPHQGDENVSTGWPDQYVVVTHFVARFWAEGAEENSLRRRQQSSLTGATAVPSGWWAKVAHVPPPLRPLGRDDLAGRGGLG
jgi:hypothetical protein